MWKISTVIWILVGVSLLILSAKLSWMPSGQFNWLGKVPITAQTLMICTWAMIVRPPIAIATVVVYFILGTCGVAVWSATSPDVDKLWSPTAGYLWGFLVVTSVISTRKISHLGWKELVGLQLTLSLIILLLGYTVLRFYLADAWVRGFSPYVPGALLKSIIGGSLVFLYYKIRPTRL